MTTSESTAANWEESKAFYDKVLGVLGYTRQMDFRWPSVTAPTASRDFWIADMSARARRRAQPRGALRVPGRRTPSAVQAFYDAALETGAESLHAPRLWPEYHPGYFGAFVRDPDGNNIEAVFHGAQPQG